MNGDFAFGLKRYNESIDVVNKYCKKTVLKSDELETVNSLLGKESLLISE
jgi:hypothetical protein